MASLSNRDRIPMVHSPHNSSIPLVGEDRRHIRHRDRRTRTRRNKRVVGCASNHLARSVNSCRLRWMWEGTFRVGWDTSSNLSNSIPLGMAHRTGTTRLGVCQVKYRSHKRRTNKLGSRVMDTFRNSTRTLLSDREIGMDSSSSNSNSSNNNHMETRAEG